MGATSHSSTPGNNTTSRPPISISVYATLVPEALTPISYDGLSLFFFLMIRPPPSSTLFPYPTLFRSRCPILPVTRDDSPSGSAPRRRAERGRRAPTRSVRCPRFREPTGEFNERTRWHQRVWAQDRKSTRLNSSHLVIPYAVFCLKKKN